MAKEKMVSLLAVHTVVFKPSAEEPEERHEPGPNAEPFEVPQAEAERLIRLGAAKPADEAEAGEEDGDDLEELTTAELEARAKELKIDVEKLEGTGKGGRVVKIDLVRAIQSVENDATGTAAAGNPSLVS